MNCRSMLPDPTAKMVANKPRGLDIHRFEQHKLYKLVVSPRSTGPFSSEINLCSSLSPFETKNENLDEFVRCSRNFEKLPFYRSYRAIRAITQR